VVRRRRSPREKVQAFTCGLQKIERLRDVWHAPLREKAKFLTSNGRKLLRAGAGDVVPETNGSECDRDWLLSVYQWVITSYVPRRFHGRVALFLTENHLRQTPFISRQWARVAPQIRVETIPGEHLTCITTCLDALAKKIGDELAAVRSCVSVLLPTLTSQLWLFEL